ncbi:MAG: FimV/HubP family polar landmark protein [Azonexus sp.]
MTQTNFKKRAVAVAIASCLSFAPWLAEAASLGKLTVLSGLGQPLRAEIEISASRAELAGMTARLAGSAAFREAGIDYASALLDLRFAIEKRSNGAPVVKISSTKPVNEPFMDMLVELSWPSGPLLREYTFLLDPPEVASRAAARQASVSVDTVRGAGAAPTASATSGVAATTPRQAPETKRSSESGTHLVQQGETLRKIAGETKYEGVSLEQMLVGLYKKNPDAFIGDNINRMKAGAILSIPDKATVAAVPAAEAKQVYVTQVSDWNAYRQKLASAPAQAKPGPDAAAQSAAGKITAQVEDKPSAVDQAKDKVKISRAEMPAKGVPGGKAAAGEEELIAKDKALKEAQDRLALLEKNVGELQKLVDMKTQRLAELQQQASGQKEEAKPVAPAEPPKAVEAPKEQAPVAAEPPKAVEEPKPVEPPKAVEAPKPAAPAEPPKPAPVAPHAPESGLLDDPLPLIAGGGILALLAGYFLLRRRRSEPEPEFTTAVPAPSSLGPNSVFRMTGGQSVDTGNVPLQTGDFSQTGPGTIDTDEVDPVAEADVYMAYGRDAQAEEILIEALRKDPHRTAIHAKLLEIYANRKSVKQFDTLASELYAQTGGVGAEWEKVAAMGAALDPENPLYSAGRGAVAATVEEVTPVPDAVTDAKSTVVLPGTLGQMAAAAAVGAALASEEPALEVGSLPTEGVGTDGGFSQTVVNSDDNSLDFDMGGTAQPFAPEATRIVDVVGEMEMPQIEAIDFDLGGVPQEAMTATEANPLVLPTDTLVMGGPDGEGNFTETFIGLEAPAGLQEEMPDVDAGLIDFELGDVASDTQTLVNPGALHEVTTGELGTETVVNSLDLKGSGQSEVTVVDGLAGLSVDFDHQDAEYDVNLSESVFIGNPMPAPEFDITSINLDLGADSPEATQVVGLSEVTNAEKAAGDQGFEEVGTKLALAKAYEEMGDLDQARELLQEVIAEGSGDLVDQAREIIGRLRG